MRQLVTGDLGGGCRSPYRLVLRPRVQLYSRRRRKNLNTGGVWRVTLVNKAKRTQAMTCLAFRETDQTACVAPAHSPESRRAGTQLKLIACAELPGGDLGDTHRLRQEMIVALPRLRRFARTLTRSVPEADDLVQEACLKALDKADQWDPSQPLDRWLFRITRNHWISELRKRKVRLGEGQVPAEEATELRSSDTGEASAMEGDLRGEIAALPEELSSVLLLVSVEGYSYAEAAELFEIPTGTVMSRIHRARKLLAERLAQKEQVVS